MEWFVNGSSVGTSDNWENTTNEDGIVKQIGTFMLNVLKEYHDRTLECRVTGLGTVHRGEVIMKVGCKFKFTFIETFIYNDKHGIIVNQYDGKH